MGQLPRAAIRGTGSYVPSKVMTNADFEKVIDTTDEWIVQRTGIKERRVMGEGETTSSMALAAAKAALADAKVDAKDLDLIVCATVTGDMPFPATACFVQQGLGVTDIPAGKNRVQGTYSLPKKVGKIRVKITDVLSEVYEQTVEVTHGR